MRALSALLLVLALAPAPAAARGIVGKGLVAGTNVSMVRLPPEGHDDWKPTGVVSGQGGVFLVYAIAGRLAAEGQIVFLHRGSTFEAGGQQVGGVWAISVHIPLLARVTLVRTRRLDLHLRAGMYLDLVAGGEYHDETDMFMFEGEGDFGAGTNYGPAGGLGLAIATGPGQLLIELRVDLGVDETSDTVTSSFRTFLLQTGYAFP